MKVFKLFLAGLFILPASVVMANVVSIGSVSGTPGAELTIPVTIDSNTDGIASIDIDVTFDETQLVTRGGGSACGFVEPGADLDTTKHGLACSEPAAGVLRVLVNTLPALGNPPVVAMGTGEMVRLRFDILPAATAPSTVALEANNTDASDTDGNTIAGVVFNDGSVEVMDTDANLTIAPASHTFPSQDINDPDQTTTFTLGNDGANDSLTIGTASVGGAPYSVTGNCDGETLAPGASCVVTVTFAPTAAGTFNDSVSVTSDANDVSATLEGTATATANLVVTPGFGPVNLGFGAPGDTITANGSVENTGSASAALSCSLAGDAEISTVPSPLVATIGAGETVPFSLACALPDLAEEGALFTATLTCNVDGDFAGIHDISCGVSTFEPLPVPTMQAWALALFAMMMLLAGFIGIRFFRA